MSDGAAERGSVGRGDASSGRRRACSLALVLGSLVLGPAVRAEEAASPPDEARAAFVRGAALSRENRWLEALAAFEASDALRPHAKTSFNVGYCLRALGRPLGAREAFARALARVQGGDVLTPEQVEAARTYLAEAERDIARVTVRWLPEGAALSVDERPLVASGDVFVPGTHGAAGAPPRAPFELWLEPGPHRVVVMGPRARAAERRITLAHGERATWVFGDDEAPPPPPPRDAGLSTRDVGAIALGAGGLALGGVAVGVTVHAASLDGDAARACPRVPFCPDGRAQALSSSADDFADVATTLVVTGSAALVGAGVLWLSPRGEAPRLAAGPGGVRFSFAF